MNKSTSGIHLSDASEEEGGTLLKEKDRVEAIFHRFETMDPDPQTELFFTTDFSLLMAVILSAQATDSSVNTVMKRIISRVDTPQKVIALGEKNLAEEIRSLNIYRNKARYIHQTAQKLVSEFDGKVPLCKEDLVKLPGVGPKTANVVLNVLQGAARIAVDTHVFRVSRRLGLSKATTPTALEEDLYKVVPEQYWSRTNHWFVLHGRYICRARSPLCGSCDFHDLCPWKRDHTSNEGA